jgi:hypothetical protein
MKSETVVLVKLALSISLLFIIACASNNTKTDTKTNTKTELQNFYKELDASINIMTYDDALMRWGEPSSVTQGEEIFIVTWRKEKEIKAVRTFRESLFVVPISRGSELRLTFDKSTKKMIKWDHKKW